MKILKPGYVKLPRTFYGKCDFCGCEFLICENEMPKPHAYACQCPNKSCKQTVVVTVKVPDEYKTTASVVSAVS